MERNKIKDFYAHEIEADRLEQEAFKIAQLAYWIGESFQGKGIATEATKAVLKFGLESLQLDMIFAECHIENKASQKVLLNNGMIRKGDNGSIIQYWLTRKNSKPTI